MEFVVVSRQLAEIYAANLIRMQIPFSFKMNDAGLYEFNLHEIWDPELVRPSNFLR